MTTVQKLEMFGQRPPSPQQMTQMARAITEHIGDGKPVSFAGFAWYRPRASFPDHLEREISDLLRVA